MNFHINMITKVKYNERKTIVRHTFTYYPQRAQRAGGIVRVWQIFGHGYDFPTWSELGTKSRVKVPNFGGKNI